MTAPRASRRAVLFDLDGTLLDTLQDIGSAMNHALGTRGLAPHSPEAYRRFIGEGVRTLVQRAVAAAGGGAELEEAVLAEYRRRYAERLVEATRPYPGIPELLEALRGRGMRVGVLSNKPDDPTRTLVSRFFPGRVDVARGERPGSPRKPDPASALEVARELGASPGECLFVGDTKVDMGTARNAGMGAVGVLWGFRGREELEAHGAEAIVSRPEEILALL